MGFVLSSIRGQQPRPCWVCLITINIGVRREQSHSFIKLREFQKCNVMPSAFYRSKHHCNHPVWKNNGLELYSMMSFMPAVKSSLYIITILYLCKASFGTWPAYLVYCAINEPKAFLNGPSAFSIDGVLVILESS